MKLAILGTGLIVDDMLPMLVENRPEKIYLYSTKRSEEKALALKERFSLDGVYTELDALLASDADTVYVALPNSLHHEYALKALNAGKHVIIEKPSVPRLSELKTLAALAKEKGLILLEAISTVHQPAFYALKEQLPRVGAVKLVNFNFSRISSRFDRFRAGESIPVFDPAKAGGTLLDLNVYSLSVVMGLFGKPVEQHYYPNIENGVDTSGVLILDYGSFKAALTAAKDCSSPCFCSVAGELGCLYSSDEPNSLRSFSFVSRFGDTESFEFSREHRMAAEFRRFEDIIDNLRLDEAAKLLKASADVCEVMEKARRAAGIVYPGDSNETA